MPIEMVEPVDNLEDLVIEDDDIPQFKSVFEGMLASSYPFRYEGELLLRNILGGTPSDPNVIEGWLRTKLGLDKDAEIRNQVMKIMEDRGISQEEATAEVAKNRSLNGFLRARCRDCDETGPLCPIVEHQLYVSGRQLKAGLKEAANIAVASGKLPGRGWGTTNKGLLSFFAEHFFVVEDELLLTDRNEVPVWEPTGVIQHFVHTRFGSALQYQEYVNNARLKFTVMADYYLTPEEWGLIWTTQEFNGLGASRSQGYGRHKVIQWKDTTDPAVNANAKARLAAAKAKKAKEEDDDATPKPVKRTARKAVDPANSHLASSPR
jgi:hypothetical protein